MDFFDLIDKTKIAERAAEREADFNTPESIASRERAKQARVDRIAAFERGKIALGIVREETGPNYGSTYFDASGHAYTIKDLETAGEEK